MTTDDSALRTLISRQRASLYNMLIDPMRRSARRCAQVWGDKALLDETLTKQIQRLPYCTFMYAMDTDAIQVSENVGQQGLVASHHGRDRADRPYMRQLDAKNDMNLSESYLSLRANRPSITAVQKIQQDGELLGWLGADFDLRDLPLTRELYEQPGQWRQIKGDPSIRSQVFAQCRVESGMDRQIDSIVPVVDELMTQHGVFHGKLHFSSSRATLWTLADPYRYHIINHEELMDPEICLAYPTCPYPADALVPAKAIRPILDTFRHLRFSDQTIYLRAGSVNIFNGMVGLNFSCDGSHYIPFDQFLARDSAFWAGM